MDRLAKMRQAAAQSETESEVGVLKQAARQDAGFGKALVFVARDDVKASVEAARNLFELMKKKENPVIGLATGRTFELFYDYVSQNYKKQGCSFANATTFNLDEYIGIGKENPASYRQYMKTKFFLKIDIREDNAFLPDGNAKDARAEAEAYEKKVAEKGGIDLLFLGIGQDGHIGFNEPGTGFGSKTHIVRLSCSTLSANSTFFAGGSVPKTAITMGIETIMSAKKIIAVATGKQKNGIIRKIFESDVTEGLPATVLKMHDNAVFILDSEAAAGISAGR